MRLVRPDQTDALTALDPPRPAHDLIIQIHRDSRGSYGGHRVHAELALGRGIEVGHGQVERPMRRAGLQGVGERSRWKRVKPDNIATDLVKRDFACPGPNQLWVTDITEHTSHRTVLVEEVHPSTMSLLHSLSAALGSRSRGRRQRAGARRHARPRGVTRRLLGPTPDAVRQGRRANHPPLRGAPHVGACPASGRRGTNLCGGVTGTHAGDTTPTTCRAPSAA
ncbi:IS3 family transposase [Nocardioides kribbensis]|uniref:IS3 family transposase n=1 Tax=Nocardioides kribbensis TaxID=305517 RepID=UPI00187A34C9